MTSASHINGELDRASLDQAYQPSNVQYIYAVHHERDKRVVS